MCLSCLQHWNKSDAEERTNMTNEIGNNERSVIRVGDVMRQDGVLLVCFRVNDASAWMQPLTKRSQTIKPRGDTDKFGGKERTFTSPDTRISHFSSGTNGPFIKRLGDNWQQADLKTSVPGFEGEVNVIRKPKCERKAEKLAEKLNTHQTTSPEEKRPETASAAQEIAPPQASSPKKRGKCQFIYALLETGKWTKAEILAKTLAEFPGDPVATERTLHACPAMMRKAGRVGMFAELK